MKEKTTNEDCAKERSEVIIDFGEGMGSIHLASEDKIEDLINYALNIHAHLFKKEKESKKDVNSFVG